MTTKDYYLALGVPRTESPQGIRSAFRNLARRHHPDRAGPAGTPRFCEVLEAYRVLSDPEQRRAYDYRLRELDRPPPPGTPRARAEVRPPEPLLCDVRLTASEARRGGTLPIRVPILAPCPACHGTGHLGGLRCRACAATGEVRAEALVPLEIPRGVRSGTILDQPLGAFGIRNLWLRARIGVAG